MDSAPIDNITADGPAGAAAWWLTTSDKVRIRIGVWPATIGTAAKGTILMFPGRTEYIEKYGRTARQFADAGFATLAIDWRGQGLADRLLKNPAIGHVNHFPDFQNDVAAVVQAAKDLRLPKPWFVIGHSMGGAIGLRAVMEGLPVNACAFSAPMWDIALNPLSRRIALGLAAVLRPLGLADGYAPTTTRNRSYAATVPFEGNRLTTDPEMLQFMQDQAVKLPGTHLGGASLRWVQESLHECAGLAARPSPDVPCITFLGTDEKIVSQTAIRDRMARWPNGDLIELPNGRHEVMMEAPAIRDRVHACILAHFKSHL